MDIATIARLLAWDEWANTQMLQALRHAGAAAPPEAVRLLAHVAAVEHLWHARLVRSGAAVVVWPEHGLERVGEELAAAARRWSPLLAPADAAFLDAAVPYVNSQGERWESSRRDMLLQVVTHGSHHRGQIAAALRSAGIAPPYTDYVQATRSGALGAAQRSGADS